MRNPPKDRAIFAIRLSCGFCFFGLIFALIGLRFIESANPWRLGIWVAITFAVSFYAAWEGDGAWKRLIAILRWW